MTTNLQREKKRAMPHMHPICPVCQGYCKLSPPTETVSDLQPRDHTGKYNYTHFGLICVCGHTLGVHLANPPRACGSIPGESAGCKCQDFKKARKQPNPPTETVSYDESDRCPVCHTQPDEDSNCTYCEDRKI